MEIDLEEFLSKDADKSNSHKYLLHGFVYIFIILVHHQLFLHLLIFAYLITFIIVGYSFIEVVMEIITSLY
jgi:hypothetical protein